MGRQTISAPSGMPSTVACTMACLSAMPLTLADNTHSNYSTVLQGYPITSCFEALRGKSPIPHLVKLSVESKYADCIVRLIR